MFFQKCSSPKVFFKGKPRVLDHEIGNDAVKGHSIVIPVAREKNENVFQVTCADELDPKWFKNKESVGISAGASTPAYLIEEVKNKIEIIYEGNNEKRDI